LSADVAKQLRRRTVRLQQLGFGLARNHVRMFSVQICKEHNMQYPRNNEMVGKIRFISFLRRNLYLTMRKAENLSYGRLVGFIAELVDDFFKLSM
jgi:hypothetical protein